MDVPTPLYSRVDRTYSGELAGCEAIGYPLWQLDPVDHQRSAAELHGTIRKTEDAESQYLLLRSRRILRPPACRPASCLTWLPTMLPNAHWFPG